MGKRHYSAAEPAEPIVKPVAKSVVKAMNYCKAKPCVEKHVLVPHCADKRVVCDEDGRPFNMQVVVVNFLNVGATYGSRVLKRNKLDSMLFDYEGVRRCVEHLSRRLGL